MSSPYKDIFKLPDLTDKYTTALAEQCQKDREPLLSNLEDNKKSIFTKLEGKSYKDDFNASLIKRFDAMERKIKECNEPATLKSMNYEIDLIYTDALNEIDMKDAEINIVPPKGSTSDAPPLKTKHTNHVPIKSLVSSPSWRIETIDDIDEYLTELKLRIAAEMKDDDIISVEF
jgi:hypothetical protein